MTRRLLLGLGPLVLLLGCRETRTAAPAHELEGGLPPLASDASTKAKAQAVDAGQPSSADHLVWSVDGRTVAYLRDDDLLFVETERFTLKRRVKLPHLELGAPVLLQRGGALVFANEPAGSSTIGEAKVVIVATDDASGPPKVESLGKDNPIALDTEEGGLVRSPAIIDEANGTLVRVLGEMDADGAWTGRAVLEVRALADAKLKSRTKLPSWFRHRMKGPPHVLGCRGMLCAFGVVPQESSSFDDATQSLALFDLEERAPRLVGGVLLGPSPGIVFGPKGTLAVTFGAGADPIIVDPKTNQARSLGRRGKKVDPMHAGACIAFSRDGALIASAADNEPVALFEVATGKRRWRSPEDASSVAHWNSCGVAFAEDGSVLDYSRLGNIQKLDAATGRRSADLRLGRMHSDGRPVAVGNESWLTSGALSPKASFFIVTDRERGDVLLDVLAWKKEAVHGGGTFSPDDRFYIESDRVFALADRKPIATLP